MDFNKILRSVSFVEDRPSISIKPRDTSPPIYTSYFVLGQKFKCFGDSSGSLTDLPRHCHLQFPKTEIMGLKVNYNPILVRGKTLRRKLKDIRASYFNLINYWLISSDHVFFAQRVGLKHDICKLMVIKRSVSRGLSVKRKNIPDVMPI